MACVGRALRRTRKRIKKEESMCLDSGSRFLGTHTRLKAHTLDIIVER